MTVVQSEGALVTAHRPWTPSGIRGGLTFYSGEFSDYAAIYRTQPNLQLVVRFLARNIAQLKAKAYRRISDDERAPLDFRHDLARVLRHPNPYITRHAWVRALISDLKVYDVFAALKVRNPANNELRLFRIPPYMFRPIGDSWVRPDGIKLLGNKAQPEFPLEQLVYLHGYNPEDARLGLSPIESLRRILAEDLAAGEWRESYWKGAARQAGIIERPAEAPKWSDPARNRFLADWQSMYGGSGSLAGATAVLEEGMSWKEASFSPKDSEYLAARRLSREECAANYHVSPLFVGILENANFSNVAEQHKHLYQDTLGPDLDWIEEELELQLLPEYRDLDPDEIYLEFNLAEKLKGTFEEQAAVLQTLIGAPVMVRDEGRARLNLSPLPDGQGQQIVTPLNVLVGGQASPRDSAPGTARRAPLGKIRRGAIEHAKAAEDLPRDVRGWHAKHIEVLASFFDRQQAAVMSRLGAGQTIDEAWDDSRWDGELEADLFGLSIELAGSVAADVAERFGGTYDEALALGFLQETSRIAAENVNATTRAAVADAVAPAGPGFASRAKDLDPLDETDDDEELDPLEAAAGVFAAAIATRADEIAVSRVTSIGNFGRHEGAAQSGVPFKVWHVNSAQSRAGHPGEGETVPLDGVFSNGARWPGDANAGIAQTAGCTCSLDFTTEEP